MGRVGFEVRLDVGRSGGIKPTRPRWKVEAKTRRARRVKRGPEMQAVQAAL